MDDLKAFKNGVVKQNSTFISDASQQINSSASDKSAMSSARSQLSSRRHAKIRKKKYGKKNDRRSSRDSRNDDINYKRVSFREDQHANNNDNRQHEK